MAVNRGLLKERLNLNPGLMGRRKLPAKATSKFSRMILSSILRARGTCLR
jgi:hypothetical protein